MKYAISLFLLCVLLSLSGCRRPSSHGRGARHPEDRTVTEPIGQGSYSPPKKASVPSHRQEKEALDGSEIFERYGTAVFMVFTSDGMNRFQGSGFFISNDGLAVSNYHVFKGTSVGMEYIKLADDENLYKVTEVVGNSKGTDFETEDYIVFRVNCKSTNYIPIAQKKPKIGDKVYAIGSPRGLENTFSSGEVSQWRGENLMQISALIDHGSSGGALINSHGEVVGITSGSFADGSQANLNYAWSIDVVKPYIR